MGNQVIYLPPKPSFGSNLGQGVSGALSEYAMRDIDQQIKQQESAQIMRVVDAIKAAPTREDALRIAATPGLPGVRNPQDMAHVMTIIDHVHPPRDETPTKVTTYDEQGGTGEAFVPKNKLTQLNTPGGQQQLLGPGKSTTKPQDMVDFYKVDPAAPGGFTYTGKRPNSQRAPGEVTMAELALQKQDDASRRATDTADRAVARDRRQTEVDAQRVNQQDFADRKASYNTIISTIGDAMNAKKTVGQDGAFNLDFENDPEKLRIFNQKILPNIDKMLDNPKMKGRFGEIASTLLDNAGYNTTGPGKNPEPAKPKPAAEPSLRDKATMAVGDVLFKDKPAAKPAATSQTSSEVEAALKKAGQPYEPDKYDYRIVNGKLQKKAKNG